MLEESLKMSFKTAKQLLDEKDMVYVGIDLKTQKRVRRIILIFYIFIIVMLIEGLLGVFMEVSNGF